MFFVDAWTLFLATTMSCQYLKHVEKVSHKKPSCTSCVSGSDNTVGYLALEPTHAVKVTGLVVCRVSRQL